MNQVSATPIADMIGEMLEQGTPLDTILLAVRSFERAASTRHPVDATAEKRRAWDRQYRREKRGSPPDPPDIHPNPPDEALSLGREERGLSVKVGKKEQKETKTRGTKIPPDWMPNDRHYEEGAKLGMSRAEVDERASRMRLWCEANANKQVTTKANWDATFMGTWLKDMRNGNRTSHARANPATGRPATRADDFVAAVGRGALAHLAKGTAAGREGQIPRSPDFAGPAEPTTETDARAPQRSAG